MMKNILILFIAIMSLSSCVSKRTLQKEIIESINMSEEVSQVQVEIDEIFMLLAYSLVYQDWQEDSIPRFERRGYNIGAVIVNEDNKAVEYGLNSINSTDNSTQHGELRAITKYLSTSEKRYNLSGHTIYATLEPCVMCAGMITMTSTNRVIFGQNDVEYSKAFERLAIDTRPIGGFAPYPRTVSAKSTNLDYVNQLNEAYNEFLNIEEEKFLARFLVSEKAKIIFKSAYEEFLSYSPKFKENEEVYNSAKLFFEEKSQ